MGKQGNRQTVERLIQCLNDRRIEVMDELFHEDAVMEWPQSGERIVGGDNRRGVYKSFPGLPTFSPRRLLANGDLVTLEATLDYGEGAVFQTVFIFELREGKIAKETAYWAQPFEAPEWRAQWVERM
jgi:ketosteroid isomerase-like protein